MVKAILALKFIFRKIVSRIYCPKAICPDKLEAKDSFLIEKEDGIHRVLVLKDGRIFTDLCIIVGIMKGRWLYKTFSCQFSDDLKFSLLNNHFGVINRFPVRVHGNVVSLISGGGGNYNYYHWLFDVLPRFFLVRDVYGVRPEDVFLVPDNRLEFQRSSLKLLGVKLANSLSSFEFQHVRADLLIAATHPKAVKAGSSRQISPWICDELRTAFIKPSCYDSLGCDAEIFHRKIYISRGDNTNHRNLIDEQPLMDELLPRGFHSYMLSSLTFEQQVRLFASAEVVVGVHGAGLANIVFAPENIKVVEIASKEYCPSMYQDIAFCRHQEYEMVFACADDTIFSDVSKQSIRLGSDGISRLLALLDN